MMSCLCVCLTEEELPVAVARVACLLESVPYLTLSLAVVL